MDYFKSANLGAWANLIVLAPINKKIRYRAPRSAPRNRNKKRFDTFCSATTCLLKKDFFRLRFGNGFGAPRGPSATATTITLPWRRVIG